MLISWKKLISLKEKCLLKGTDEKRKEKQVEDVSKESEFFIPTGVTRCDSQVM